LSLVESQSVDMMLEKNELYGPIAINTVPEKPVISLHGYYQSFRYFDHRKDDLRKIFKPSYDIVDAVLQAFPRIRDPGSVAIHVRRGDYLHPHIQLLYSKANKEYFIEGLKKIKTVKRIFIASDDIEWCQNVFNDLPYPVYYSNGTSALFDIVMLAMSDSLVIPNSSFGWWAAYLKMLHYGNGTVISMRPWYKDTGSLSYLNENAKHFYLPHWKVLDVW
jgi:hypothetical protein